jgi:hypothetical protein
MITRRKKNLLWLTLLIVIVVAVGAAFTDTNTITAHAGETLGLGTAAVTGGTVTSIDYAMDASDGTTVGTVVFIASGDLSPTGPSIPAVHGWVSFHMGGSPGTNSAAADCGTGVRAGTGPYTTTFTCDVSALAQPIDTVTGSNIVIAS